MIKKIELVLLPQEAADKGKQVELCASTLSVSPDRIFSVNVLKRSIDARSRQPKVRLAVEVFIDEDAPSKKDLSAHFHFKKDVSKSHPVLIIGCGPAGLFAALKLIELGFRPVIIERGKNVQNRRRDLAAINKSGIVNPDSNYCFGEGGAGTYSDGKLYTRSGKRGDVNRILEILVYHGSDENILVDAHPHIGTNKLPKVVEAIRHTILNAGGEIHFETCLKDFIIQNNKVEGIIARQAGNEIEFRSERIILATGHSARDIFHLLNQRNILIEAKPFALGVRMEHPQHIIDSLQYHCDVRGEFLPPASYSLVAQSGKRGVYSFCMCPGGIIAPASTDINEIVVNGWSPSKRNNPFANSGLVVSVDAEDYAQTNASPLDALNYQAAIEQKSFHSGGGKLKAPAQRLIDFVERKHSSSLPTNSYIPGLTSFQLDDTLPLEITKALRESLKEFGKKLKSLYTNEAILVATESRTSSPVRIPRDRETLEHPQIHGLFPCGEGAGYAGGIVSAAMDGERCAMACIKPEMRMS
ncbi:FAD-binding protein [soil metagenome]